MTGIVSAALWRRPRVALAATLLPPLAWFVLIYLTALAVLFVAAFWSVDALSGATEVLDRIDAAKAPARAASQAP